jgi:hypothetical protein
MRAAGKRPMPPPASMGIHNHFILAQLPALLSGAPEPSEEPADLFSPLARLRDEP